MRHADPNHGVFRISLRGRKHVGESASTLASSTGPAKPDSTPGMTMAHLRGSFEAIVQARAIFYPVAYQFLRELGRGRQGIVFLGLRQGARGCITEHAIKVFDPGIYRSPVEYWTDMGRIALQLSRLQSTQSPNLVSGFSYEETYGIGYVQMEAIDGMDLRRLLSVEHLEIAAGKSTPEEWARFNESIFYIDGDRMCLQPGMVVYILRRLFRGVERLHEMNFLHCDIKPSNVMIDRLGLVKIVDLGRAVIAGEKVTFLLGSPMYMAPETHRRELNKPQSDFYGIGLVGMEMLRGEPLTNPDNVDEDFLLRLKMELPSILMDMLPPHVRKKRALTRIIRRLLDPDPAKRFMQAREADVGNEGLIRVETQYAKAGVTADYGRALSDYFSKLVDERTKRIELDPNKQNENVPSQKISVAGGPT